MGWSATRVPRSGPRRRWHRIWQVEMANWPTLVALETLGDVPAVVRVRDCREHEGPPGEWGAHSTLRVLALAVGGVALRALRGLNR
jgi:hypothetical protein